MVPVSLCLHQLIEEQTRRTPDQPALRFEDQTLTYRELERRASILAQHLRKLGVGPDAPVGLFVERSLEMMIGILGVLKAGGAYVPMDTSYPPERLAFMLSDAGAKVLVTQTSLLPKLPPTSVQRVTVDDFDSQEPVLGESGVEPHHLAYVIYTSGSTGKPKGVGIEHRNIVNYVLGVAERLRLEPGMSYATVSTVAVSDTPSSIGSVESATW